jgi:carboxylesterase
MSSEVIVGAEPISHHGEGAVGVLVLHGFTGNPSSLRSQSEALIDAGYHVESPRLPGHGTTVEEMLQTDWSDWTGEVAAAYERLVARAEHIVVIGLSMGGTLTLWAALEYSDVRGIVCVNPATMPQAGEVTDMLREMIAGGDEVMPGIGSDIADPDVTELAYEGTPLQPLLSLVDDGLTPLSGRYGDLKMPLLLFTSHQDHVVEPANSEHLAGTYGGDVDHVWLERSYHVATQDYDRDLINAGLLEFVARVTAA